MHRYPFIVDIPADEYHEAARRGEFLSSHLLGDFRACPRLYRKKMSGEIEPVDTAAYQTGRALHTLILEGRSKFDEEYLISSGPTNLSPKILRAVIAKTLPDDFSTERLFSIKSDLWSEQEREIGLA